jgi:hypothetical protein
MKSKRSKNSKPQTALELGQEFLNSFKELPYSEDRLGQSVVMKASSAGAQAGKTDLPADPIASENPSETVKLQKYRVTIKPRLSEPKPSEPATEEPETAQEDLSLFFEYIRFLRAIDRD